MRWAAVRICMLLAIVLSLTLRVHSIEKRDDADTAFGSRRSIETYLEARGFALIENDVKPPRVLSAAVYFQRPECSGKSIVIPFYLNVEATELLNRVLPNADYAHAFFYLDKTWPSQNRPVMYAEWLRHMVIDRTLGSQFISSKAAIVVAEPAACFDSRISDWTPVWQRSLNGFVAHGRV